MEEEDKLLPSVSSSPLFGEAHIQHLLLLHTQKQSHTRRRLVVALFAVIYFCTSASNMVLAPFFPVKVSIDCIVSNLLSSL